MKKQLKMMLLITLLGIGFQSCKDESNNLPTPLETPQAKAEGEIKNTWVLEADMLPEYYKNNYDRMEFYVDENNNYSWKWVAKAGTGYDFTGDLYYEKSSFKHNESSIWNIRLNVTHINGQSLPGGWYGIFTYETENVLVLNIEPDTQNWGIHPTAEGGIGSGKVREESVFRFKLVD